MTDISSRRDALLAVIDASLAAVSPDPALRTALDLDGDRLTVDGRAYDLAAYDRILILGAGKASAAMAETMESLLGDRLTSGLVVTKYDHGLPLAKTEVLESAHPVPDAAGERAAARLLDMAEGAGERDLVFVLLSGGASALVPSARPPVTLAHKQAATRELLACGATINEINAIRKHLSRFKGGHLAGALEPAEVVTLIISDVVGDDLDVIGSGPTAPDGSTFFDCRAVLDRYSLCTTVPADVMAVIDAGVAGDETETRKAGDSCFDRVRNVIVAGNGMALDGAARAAQKLGYTATVVDDRMQGEARDVAARLVRAAWDVCDNDRNERVCLLAGGETTVTIRGEGKGGRNQEMALAAAVELARRPEHQARIAVACVGTDGSDGPTDAAGGLIAPGLLTEGTDTFDRALRSLDDNDAYRFLSETGAILKTGPTRTNVMDVTMLLVDPA